MVLEHSPHTQEYTSHYTTHQVSATRVSSYDIHLIIGPFLLRSLSGTIRSGVGSMLNVSGAGDQLQHNTCESTHTHMQRHTNIVSSHKTDPSETPPALKQSSGSTVLVKSLDDLRDECTRVLCCCSEVAISSVKTAINVGLVCVHFSKYVPAEQCVQEPATFTCRDLRPGQVNQREIN